MITKYQDFRIEIKQLWRKKTTSNHQCIGCYFQMFYGIYKSIRFKRHKSLHFSKSAILGASSILSTTLQLSS